MSVWPRDCAEIPFLYDIITVGDAVPWTLQFLIYTMGLYGSCLSLICMCFVKCNSTLAIVFLCLAVSVNGAKYCGAAVSEQDIAPNLAGVLKGIANTIGGITGIIAPLMTGEITTDNQTLSAWRTVFSIAAAGYFITATGFLIFGTDKVQPWNYPKGKKEDNKY